MKAKQKKSSLRYAGVILGAIFLVSALSTIVSPKIAHAEVAPVNYTAVKFSDMSVQQKAEVWDLGRAVSKCISDQGFDHQNYKDSDMEKGQWLEGASTDMGEFAADLTEGQSDDSKGSCNKAAVDVLQRMGINTISALCEMNDLGGHIYFKREHGDCRTGAGDLDFQEGSGEFSDNNTDIWNRLFRKWLGGGTDVDVGTALSDGMRYVLYSEDFYQECSQDHGKGWSVSAWTDTSSDSDQNSYKLKWNMGGATPDKDWLVVSADKHKDHEVHIDGYGMLKSGDRMNCDDLAKNINKYASAYVREEAQSPNPDDPQDNQTQNGADSGDGDATQCNIPKTGWILCPVLDTMANIGDQAFGFLSDNFFSVDTELFDNSSGTYTAWTKFRDIANIAFVIAIMIVVYSQLTGAGISNYGIKKLLPKVVIAAILVNLSYFICQLAVDISNLLGYTLKDWFDSLAGSIKLPGGDISNASTSTTTDSPLGWVGIVGVIVVAGTVAWLALGALIPMLLAAIIAMFMILFILLARKALIVLLIALAPLAFVAYLLPNTEQWYKRWQKTFFQLLMVFPIIAVVFGAAGLASKIVSVGASGDATDDNIMLKIIAAGIAVIPLFVVPGLLKKSVDAAGNIGAKINGVGNKVGGWAGKRGSERFDRSAVGRGRALRRQAKNQYRDRRFAERLNKGGVTGVLAGGAAGVLPRRLQTKGAQYQQEALSRSAAGTAREAESKDVNYESAQLNTEATKQAAYTSPTTGKGGGAAYLQDQFNQAIQEGNTVKAKAALQSLKAQGDSGVEAIQETLAQHSSAGGKLDNTEMSHDLRSYVAESHSDLKGKDSRITNWAGEGGEEAIKKADFSGLTDAQVASQTKASLAAAQSSTTTTTKPGAMLDSTRSARVKAAADAGTIELKESKRNAMP